MRTLNLDILKQGFSGISSTRGAFYREAVVVALKQYGFVSGVELKVSGAFEEKKKQIRLSDASKLSGWIVVVEFSEPQSKIIKK